MTIDSIGQLSEDDLTKISGQIGTLQSVAIFERRHEAVEIRGASAGDSFFTSEDEAQRTTTYFAKPYETFCVENVSFITKHLNETVWASGIHSLFNSETMHNTFYKESSMVLEKRYPRGGGTVLRLSWTLSYVTERKKETKSL